MTKKNLAVLFGGCSPEYPVSLQSASAVLEHIDRSRYHVLPIGINRHGDWFHYTGPLEHIASDSWQNDPSQCTPIVFSQSRIKRGFFTLTTEGTTFTSVDLALPMLHGENGEDGTVQGFGTG